MENIVNDPFWNTQTFVISSNNLKMMKYFDKIIFIENGKIIHFKSPNEIKKEQEFKEISLKVEKEEEEKSVKN